MLKKNKKNAIIHFVCNTIIACVRDRVCVFVRWMQQLKLCRFDSGCNVREQQPVKCM